MKRRRYLCVALLLLLVLALTISTDAHPGDTDANGGHTDKGTGDYHYHHGYPAHDHYDMDGDGIVDCPYDFDDKTGQGSGSQLDGGIGSNGSINSSTPSNNSDPSTNEDVLEPTPSPPDNQGDKPWWKRPIDESVLMASIFGCGIPALLIAVALYFLSLYLDKHEMPRLSRLSWILCVLSGLVSLPFAMMLFAILFTVSGGIFLVIWLLIYPFMLLVNFIKSHIKRNPKQNIIHVQIPRPIEESQTDSPAIAEPSTTDASLTPPNTPARKVSRMLWLETDRFYKSIDNPPDSRQFMHIWAVYFYVVAKSTKSQAFINEVYSYFDDCAARYAGQFDCCLLSVSDMRSAYREIRPLLNASKIDPTNPAGTDLLWEFVVENVFGGTPLPSVARNQFDTSIRVLSRYSRYSCNNNSAQVKYSISEPSSDLLPDK